MKAIKFTILVLVLSLWSVQGFSQHKKSTHQKRAEAQTAYIADKMDLNEDQKTFVYEVLIKKFKMNTDQLKGKELTQEQKRAIYKETNKKTRVLLATKFSKEEIDRINKLQSEANKMRKKK